MSKQIGANMITSKEYWCRAVAMARPIYTRAQALASLEMYDVFVAHVFLITKCVICTMFIFHDAIGRQILAHDALNID